MGGRRSGGGGATAIEIRVWRSKGRRRIRIWRRRKEGSGERQQVPQRKSRTHCAVCVSVCPMFEVSDENQTDSGAFEFSGDSLVSVGRNLLGGRR